MDAIAADRLVAVIALTDAGDAAALGAALLSGGLRCAEVTLRTPAALAAIAAMAALPGLVVGAGTVLTAEQAEQAVAAGARFVVSPGLSLPVLRRCRELGVPAIPGVLTPTEILAALAEGLDTVKFFPAEAGGGVAMIRALAAPFAGVRFIPTGGVSPENLASYLAVPAVLAVGGSWMVSPKVLAAGDWARVTELATAAVAEVHA
jgi:2-dehydro-3-deoxyphosphogluconate aldolase/(4S)-4-hydroxy-2-oxoglutarate aldolase